MEKSCGKVCGECGKVGVFNKYFGIFKFAAFQRPMHTGMYISLRKRAECVLCYRQSADSFLPYLPKKLAIIPKRTIYPRGFRGRAAKFL